jgi:RNA polymerase sigma factor (sigma-70 family)
LQTVTENQLINGIQSGDESAFRELVEAFQKQVFNTCNAIVHNTHDADDLSQEVFIEVFRSAGSFRGDSKLSTWIYRIAVNKALNHIRHLKRRNWLQSLEDFFHHKKSHNISRSTIHFLPKVLRTVSVQASCIRQSTLCPKISERHFCSVNTKNFRTYKLPK